MAHYIDKYALVAEINQRIEDYKSYKIDDSYHDGLIFALEDLRDDFLDTLEVKEVNLEEKLSSIDDSFFELGDGVAVKGATHYLTIEDIKEIAKLYYEYGLNAQKGESV